MEFWGQIPSGEITHTAIEMGKRERESMCVWERKGHQVCVPVVLRQTLILHTLSQYAVANTETKRCSKVSSSTRVQEDLDEFTRYPVMYREVKCQLQNN